MKVNFLKGSVDVGAGKYLPVDLDIKSLCVRSSELVQQLKAWKCHAVLKKDNLGPQNHMSDDKYEWIWLNDLLSVTFPCCLSIISIFKQLSTHQLLGIKLLWEWRTPSDSSSIPELHWNLF